MVSQRNITLPAFGGWSGMAADLMPDLGPFEGYAVVQAGAGADPNSLIGFETYGGTTDFAGLAAIPGSGAFETGHATSFLSQGGYVSTLVLVNYASTPHTVSVTVGGLAYNGRAAASPTQTEELTLAPYQRAEVRLHELFDFEGDDVISGFVRFQVQDDTAGLLGYMELSGAGGRLTALPIQGMGYSNSSFSYMADGPQNYTAIALTNPGFQTASIVIDAFDPRGYALGSKTITLDPGGNCLWMLRDLIPKTGNQTGR